MKSKNFFGFMAAAMLFCSSLTACEKGIADNPNVPAFYAFRQIILVKNL
ncbi:MAG: hypothetical protein LBC89_03315 [Bacteroidales bacterium]|nr:hypothetical protein [Bacteroidales bacterium]